MNSKQIKETEYLNDRNGDDDTHVPFGMKKLEKNN